MGVYYPITRNIKTGMSDFERKEFLNIRSKCGGTTLIYNLKSTVRATRCSKGIYCKRNENRCLFDH